MVADIPTNHQELSASLRTLVSAVTAVSVAQGSHSEAVEAVLGHVRQLRDAAPSSFDPDFVRVVRHVYWQHPTVPSSELSVAAGFRSPAEMTVAIGPVPSGVTCDGCGEEIRRTSRTWKPPRAIAYGLHLCKPCREQRDDDRRRMWAVESLRRHHVDSAPVSARGTDWMVAVTLVLAYPPIAIGLSQEEAERHGFWRGFDVAQEVHEHLARFDRGDTVSVASRDSLDLFRVAEQVAGWDAERSIELIETITVDAPTMVLTRLRQAIDAVRQERHAEAMERFPDDHVPPPDTPLTARRW